MVQVKKTPPTNGHTNVIPIMEKIEILSADDLLKSLGEFGLGESREPNKELTVVNSILRESLSTYDAKKESIKFGKFRIKIDLSLIAAVAGKEKCTIALYEWNDAPDRDKPGQTKRIAWARITDAQ